MAGLGGIPEAQWDALFPAAYPFTRHAFLKALEDHGCVGPRTGWEPAHLVLEDDAGLAAAMPLYRKRHSYGEFVFDFGWARAAQQLRIPYYPKLSCAIPFTPSVGPRLGARDPAARAALAAAATRLWQDSRLGSIHALFLEDADAGALGACGWVERHDVQFHWSRRGAAGSFEEFLGQLSHAKRQKIRRERRSVSDAGIRFEWRRGDELSEAQWARVFALYANTYEERGQPPYLTPGFFLDYGRRSGTPLRLVLAHDGGHDGGEAIAVAITLVGGGTLYGRHWGCAEKYRGLHFETCYYQGIELCLAEGLSRFDAGTQGPHKLARGFEPVLTRSAHRIADERLAAAVAEFLAEERTEVARRREHLAEHSAYRHEAEVHG
ncbi:MAG: GNAT family N-acetyltransferase [Nevskiaceae bacterium]